MRTSGRGDEGQKYALNSDEDDDDFWGCAHEAEGLFTPLADEEEHAECALRVACRRAAC